MAEEPTRAASEEACEAFARYVAGVGADGSVDFETFCREQGELADELRRLRSGWLRELAATALTDEPVTVRIEKLVGRDVAVRVRLDEHGQELEPPVGAVAPGNGRIGRYRLGGEVARGGQGAILRVRDEDLHRQLAMKVVLGDGAQEEAPVASVAPKTLGRFLEEAQVTAQLDHPGVVPVHELGLDPAGRVYFTMKLVKGEALGAVYRKTWSGREGWSRTRALNVLVKVCDAMSYAHHKRVIHRDLKPDNVMVGGFGEVYVMDWGLARVLHAQDDKDLRLRATIADALPFGAGAAQEDAPLMTMDGDIVGTPAYMPPEQSIGDIAGMGPHSDVYSVGAMLYELLAGHPPYVDPDARPNALEILLAAQAGPPQPLEREAPDAPLELVAICEKAMERDPRRRYPDMSGLAEDLRAFLERRVVQAYEAGAVAELRKWISRNRALSAASAAAVLVLLAGLATTLVQKGRADRNAALARDREERAIRSEALATVEAERAGREAEKALQTSNFLVGLFEVVDPGESRGNTITAREILDRGAQRIDEELVDQPRIQSALMETMGTVYKSLGLYDQAAPLLERSLERRIETVGPDDLLVAETLHDLGEVKRHVAEFAEGEPLLQRALELRLAQLGEKSEAVAESQHELGLVLSGLGRFEEAQELLQGALETRRELLGEHPDVAASLSALAFNLYDQGGRDGVEPLLRESLEIRRARLGEHPDTAESLNDLAFLIFERGEHERAEALFREALEMKRKIYEGVHPEVALGLNNLAVALHERGQLEQAEELYSEALAIQRRLLGEVHPDIAQAMQNVAVLRRDQGDLVGAKELFLASVAMYHEVHGEGHPSAERPLRNAIGCLRDLAEERRAEEGERSRAYALELVDLAGLLAIAGEHDEALASAEKALAFLGEDPAATDGEKARAKSAAGAAATRLQQYDLAETMLVDSLATLQEERGPAAPATQETVRRLVRLYEAWGRSEAEEYRALLGADAASGEDPGSR